jgi:ribonuclease BN (tRNA processing enzyme)
VTPTLPEERPLARLTILGSGGPPPDPDRFGSSYVLRLGDDRLMFDCGPATTYKLARMGMSPAQIDNLFFTHHHFDHDVDYPCFLLSRWDIGSGKENRLSVYGPTLTEQLTERILDKDVGAFAHDWIARVNHPLSLGAYTSRGGVLPRKPPSLDATDIGPGQVIDGPHWRVTTAQAEHVQPYLDSLAYRLDCPDGSIVFTGDTQPCDTVVDLAREADVMLCMCWDDQDVMEENGEAAFQCGTTGAARMAQDAGVKKLVLVHVGPHLSGRGPMEKGRRDISEIYDGEVVFSDELMSLEV